jgi:hypothetical protein
MCYINVVSVAQKICVCVKMVLLLHGTHIGNGKDRSIVIFAPAGTILSSCPILSNNIWIFPSHLLTGEIFPTVQLPLPPDIQFHPLPPNFIDLCQSWNRSNNSSCMCNIRSIRIISNINNTDSNNTSSILSDFSCILSYISTISNISNSTLCIVIASSAVSFFSASHH